ncbi:PAS domain S-box protein [Congregibacter variabilis]|uniref:PAS domain S-box protein n=1 Tax=Congregibacter variabilis TaxID=3081200 RepID=A0ABZ0I222_9GAMM|nr:PAS domain S-box protein [Congregibacter sp. IMCC43200]
MRKQAEARVGASAADVSAMSEAEIQRLVYELQVHQVELELQNEQLREAQFDLASSRDRFADLYDFAPVGYLTLDEAGSVLEANLSAADILGIGRDSLLQSKLSDFLAPASQDAAYLHWQEVFASPGKQLVELDLLGPRDTVRRVRLESIASSSESAPERQCRVALVDITDLARLQKSLMVLNASLEHKVEAQVQEIRLMAHALANLNDGVLITVNRDHWSRSRLVFVNDAMCKFLGCSPGQMRNQSPEQLIGPLIGLASTAQIDHDINDRGGFFGELNYATEAGEFGELELSVTPMSGDDKASAYFVTMLRDITQRKSEEKICIERKERLQAIQDAALDAIITIDEQGIVRDCNPAVEKLFGYTPAEITGRNISMLMPSQHRKHHDDYLHQHLKTGRSRVIGKNRNMLALHRDGHSFPITLSVSKVEHLGLYTGVIADTSQLRKLQREVLVAAGDTQWRIGQALHDGPQQALAGLGLMAEGLAQDLRRQGSVQAEQASLLSQKLSQTNKDIRSLGKGLIPVQVGDSGLMSALENLSSQISDEYGLICELHCSRAVEISDHYTADQLYHIAREAVLNAARHSGADRIDIFLELRGQDILLRVVDNGSGINPDRNEGKGLGMHIMPYRAASIGAVFEISGATGGGTEVACTIEYFSSVTAQTPKDNTAPISNFQA